MKHRLFWLLATCACTLAAGVSLGVTAMLRWYGDDGAWWYVLVTMLFAFSACIAVLNYKESGDD